MKLYKPPSPNSRGVKLKGFSRKGTYLDPLELERLIAESQAPSLPRQVLSNAWSEIRGFKYLPAALAMLPLEAQRRGARYVYRELLAKPMIEYYKGYRHPLTHFKQYPLGTIFDVLGALSLGGTSAASGLAKVGQVMGKTGPGLTRAIKTAEAISKVGQPAEWVRTGTGALRKVYKTEMATGKEFPEMTRLAKLGSYAERMQAKTSAMSRHNIGKIRLFREHKKQLALVEREFKDIKSSLTPEEIAVEHIYSTTPMKELPPEIVSEFNRNPRIQKLHQAHKNLAEYNLKYDLERGNITAGQAEIYRSRSPYSIRAVRMIGDDLLKKEIERVKSDITKFLQSEKIDQAAGKEKWLEELVAGTDEVKQKLINQLYRHKQRQFYKELDNRVNYLINTFGDLAENPNLVYRYTGKFDKPFEEYLGRTAEVGKPGFSYPKTRIAPELAPYRQAQTRAMMSSTIAERMSTFDDIIQQGLKAGTIREYVPGMKLMPFERLVSPYFMRKTMRDTLRFLERIPEAKWVEAIGQAMKTNDLGLLEEAISSHHIIDTRLAAGGLSQAIKTSKYFTRQKLSEIPVYVVNKEVANILENRLLNHVSPVVQVLFDNPTNIWREFVLSMSPRWVVYNLMGNIMFNLLQGTSPRAFYRALSQKPIHAEMRGAILPEAAEGFIAAEGKGVARSTRRAWQELLGREENYAIVEMAGRKFKVLAPEPENKIYQGLELTKNALTGLKSVNEHLENVFRKASFLHEVERLARKEIVKKTGQQIFIGNELLEKEMLNILKNPARSAEAFDVLAKYMGNFWNLAPWERQLVRRIFPFYSWYSHMFKLTLWTLPAEHPAKFQFLNLMAKIGKETWTETLAAHGVDANLLPEWMRGAIPIEFNPKTKEITFWNTMGVNPFTTVTEMDWRQLLSGLDPKWKVILEQAIKEDLFRGKKFDSLTVVPDARGGLWEPDPNNPGRFRKSEGKAPPLLEHALRQFPHYQLLKNWLMWQKYGTVPTAEYAESTILHPKPVFFGKQPLPAVSPLFKGLGMFGMPLTQITPRPEYAGKMEKSAQKAMYKRLAGVR